MYIKNDAGGSTGKLNIYSANGTYFSGGNVGIGTTSPGYQFQVSGAGNGIAARIENGGNYWDIGGLGSGTAYIKGYEGNVAIGNAYTGSLYLLTGDAAKMTILNNGNVGILKSNPQCALDVNGGARFGSIQFDGTNITQKVDPGDKLVWTKNFDGSGERILTLDRNSGNIIASNGIYFKPGPIVYLGPDCCVNGNCVVSCTICCQQTGGTCLIALKKTGETATCDIDPNPGGGGFACLCHTN
jgi:hypothetical protein